MFYVILTTVGNRVDKYAAFSDGTAATAYKDAWALQYPAAQVFEAEETVQHIFVDDLGVASISSPAPKALTDSDRIDEAFPRTDVARVIFEALFEIANRLQTLEGKPTITRAQLRDWLITKLP